MLGTYTKNKWMKVTYNCRKMSVIHGPFLKPETRLDQVWNGFESIGISNGLVLCFNIFQISRSILGLTSDGPTIMNEWLQILIYTKQIHACPT